MKNRIIPIFSWIVVIWTCKVFLTSLPYKFTGHPDTQHIFGTIGVWIQETISTGLGQWFVVNGAIAVGVFELLASLLLLSPIVFWAIKKFNIAKNVPSRALIHTLGGLMSAGVMAGAIFFHLITPLGIEVLHNGVSDGGSLFYAAVSIFILGLILATVNASFIRSQNNKISS